MQRHCPESARWHSAKGVCEPLLLVRLRQLHRMHTSRWVLYSPGIIVGVGSGIGLADQLRNEIFDRMNFPEMPAAILATSSGILIGGLVVFVWWRVLTYWKQSLTGGIALNRPAEVNATESESKLNDPATVQVVLRAAGRGD